MNQALTYREKFAAEMTFGGVPCDTEWLRNSTLFQEGLKKFDSGEWKYFEKETWKDIEGFEGKYQVSNHGRVKTLAKVFHKKVAPSVAKKGRKEYIHSGTINKKLGYRYISLILNKVTRFVPIHRLVAEAFVRNTDASKTYVNHINFDKEDNHASNLEYVSNRENVCHSKSAKKKGTSRFIGVSWSSNAKKWVSAIYINGKTEFLGSYINEEDAGKAYIDALTRHGIENKYKN